MTSEMWINLQFNLSVYPRFEVVMQTLNPSYSETETEGLNIKVWTELQNEFKANLWTLM